MNFLESIKTLSQNINTVKTLIALGVLVASVLGAYFVVEDYIWTKENAMAQMKQQFLVHERMQLRHQMDYHDIQIKVTEMELRHYDDDSNLSDRDRREVERLTEVMAFHIAEKRRTMDAISDPDAHVNSHSPN